MRASIPLQLASTAHRRRRWLWLAAAVLGLTLAVIGIRHAFGLSGVYNSITYVKASNTDWGDFFGSAVALSADGSTLAVGAYGEASAATGINGNQADNSAPGSGAVYVYTRSGGTWVQQAYLKGSNSSSGSVFGNDLALSDDGSTLAVGAAGEGSGAVYVYTRSGSTWSQQAYVKASNADFGDRFGRAVALSGDGSTLAVGAYMEDSAATGINGNQADNSAIDSGAVYVYTRSGSTWNQQAYVKASNTDAYDYFGYTVALSADGSTLAVGAYMEDSAATGINGNQANNSAESSGAVYVYARSGSTWSQQAYVKASNTEAGDFFSVAVALSADGNTLAVGAMLEHSAATGINGNQANNSAGSSGAVYVYARSGSTWNQQAYVKASNTDAYDYFGYAVALSADGSTLAVGAASEASAATGINGNQANNSAIESGAVYVYTRSGSTWNQRAYVKASNTDAGDWFGIAVALSADGSTLAVGAYLEDSAATGINGNQANNSAESCGAVYVYEVLAHSISGTVFEDVNYGGGAGRDRDTALAAGGSGRPGARVELYDSAGNFVAATTTDSAGAYTFSGRSAGSYTVRVVNGSVSSARAGYSAALLPVQTFRTDASSGTVSAVTGRVGGQSPRLADAGNGSTTL
ncbi:MAG: SdrD B-like domain-containing protein, partial [Betaproteobacteria bacterium]